ncbi:hypothetical protein CCACVL1_07997 [Corchorus capsularis]|uniref:Uncharacterized protein n=1 Tax=Corchorus capsularis TaxID=210143 RepID=A0A1R3J2V7_COCAP|nr:hypothetical protein CCACVL1_07997 [Corchorus capsularis]
MEWSPQDAMKAYLQTLHLNKVVSYGDNRLETRKSSVIEPKCMELISALAAGKRAKLIVEITTQGITPLTVALGVAAKQSGGQLICIVVGNGKGKGKRNYYYNYSIKAKALEHAIKLVVAGNPCEFLMQLKKIDFAVIDCKFEDYLKLFTNLDVNLTSSTVIVRNVDQYQRNKGGTVSYGQAVKRSKGIGSVTLPIGDGIELTRIGSSSTFSRGRRRHRRFHVTFEN